MSETPQLVPNKKKRNHNAMSSASASASDPTVGVTFSFRLHKGQCKGAQEVRGIAKTEDGAEIGSLFGYLINRTIVGEEFHVVTDIISREMQEIGVMFFDQSGNLNSYAKDILGNDTKMNQKGCLNVERMTIIPAHRGKDLSIYFLKACLDHFKHKWTVVVLQPAPLHAEEGKVFADGIRKLSTMYARLGFLQLGRFSPELKYWALDAKKYTGNIASAATFSVDIAVKVPKPEQSSGEKKIATVIKKYVEDQYYSNYKAEEKAKILQKHVEEHRTRKEALDRMESSCANGNEAETANTTFARHLEQIASTPQTQALLQQPDAFDEITARVIRETTSQLRKLLETSLGEVEKLVEEAFPRPCEASYRESLTEAMSDGSSATINSAHGVHIAVGAILNQVATGGARVAGEKAVSHAFEKSVLPLLEEFEGNINNQDEEGYSPLHVAASQQSSEMVKLLIQQGGDIHIKTRRGQTPLDVMKTVQEENRIFAKTFSICQSDRPGLYANEELEALLTPALRGLVGEILLEV